MMISLRNCLPKFLRLPTCTQLITRNCHQTENQIRVRFAPSPTGYLHLGGLRTALYNYLFARANNGKFILRIEDTDQTRIVPGAAEQLLTDLEWAGIIPDESPFHSGNFGPYRQSERLDIYMKMVQRLMESGHAFYCFCTDKRLALLRKEALRAREVPKYDNKCRHLTPMEIAEKLANKDPFCIRFKLDKFTESFKDIVYGDISYDVSENEGDPVIIKSDGYPTYHFANVVDDHLMEVTHVLRGVEWQVSTTKHILLYKAFGWKPPQFAHLPLIINSDGSKLSKRQGDITIGAYRERGILPNAILNFITQSGGGFNRELHGTNLNLSLQELIEQFDLYRVNSSPGKLNPELLNECNRYEMIRQIKDPLKCDQLVETVKNLVMTSYPDKVENLDLDKDHIKDVLHWASDRITTLQELVDGNLSFLWVLPNNAGDSTIPADIIKNLVTSLEDANFAKSNLQKILKEFSSENNLQFSTFMKSLRKMISGLDDGPSVAEMMEILGRKNTLQRLKAGRTDF